MNSHIKHTTIDLEYKYTVAMHRDEILVVMGSDCKILTKCCYVFQFSPMIPIGRCFVTLQNAS